MPEESMTHGYTEAPADIAEAIANSIPVTEEEALGPVDLSTPEQPAKTNREVKRNARLAEKAERKAAKEAAAAEDSDDDDDDSPKKKKAKRQRPVTLEGLIKKFKSPIQGRQRKVQDWEDRTCYRLKAMGFRSVPTGMRTSDFCTFELECGTIRAIIRSEHSQWSSRGLVKFTDSSPVPAVVPTEPSTEG